MNRPTNAFNAIFFKELRDAYHYPLAVVGVLLLLAGPLFAPWHYVPEPTLGNLSPTIKKAAELLAGQYAGHWGRYALFSVFILATLLPAGMFARERKTKEIACLERFPVSLQTVFLAKFSAAFVLIALVAAGFVLTGFCFDSSYGMTPFSALTEFTRRFDPHELSHCKAFALSPFELLIWSAFWATLIRREAFVVTTSLLSTFAAWAVVGWAATFVGDTPTSLTTTATWRPPRDLSVVTVGGVASVESAFYATLRFGALLLPLVGIVCVLRRNGANTTLSVGLSGSDFRFEQFATKRRPQVAASASATVPVDWSASPTRSRRRRSPSVLSRLVGATPRRFRSLAALCFETVGSASVFGRFPGAPLLDVLLLNYLFFKLLIVADAGVFAVPALLFLWVFGSGAFEGLRRERRVLTAVLPASPRLYFASQLLSYGGLYLVGFLAPFCLRVFFPDAFETLSQRVWPQPAIDKGGDAGWASCVAYLVALHCVGVFCGAALSQSRLGACGSTLLLYAATFGLFILTFGVVRTSDLSIVALIFWGAVWAGGALTLAFFATKRRFYNEDRLTKR